MFILKEKILNIIMQFLNVLIYYIPSYKSTYFFRRNDKINGGNEERINLIFHWKSL